MTKDLILVTGGAGFIGSNILAGLEADGWRLAALDHAPSPEKARNYAKRKALRFLLPHELQDFLQQERGTLAAIVHMGAISDTTASDAALIEKTNVTLSQELWAFAAEVQVPFIYASSASTYGDGAEGFEDSNELSYLERLKPLNLYGRSKHRFDLWAIGETLAGRRRPLQWAGLKFFNVYGPNEWHKGPQQSVAAQLFRQLSEKGSMRLFQSHREGYEHGGQKRDFVWVGDCVAVVRWLLQNPGAQGLFNVGSGKAESFKSVAEAVAAALGQPAKIDYIPMPEALRQHYQYFTEAPLGRLRAAGFSAATAALSQGVASYVTDFLAKEDPYL